MSDIVFLITTYGRQASCQRLVDSLQGLGDIVVVGDGCGYNIARCRNINLPIHGGRIMYWDTVRVLFSHRGKHQYYFMLPDDCLPVPGMVEKAIDTWQKIKDPNKACLNLHTDRVGVACWTGILPKDKGFVYRTGWVDMCFLAEETFFRSIELKPNCPKVGGSGVGAQISRQLVRKRLFMYQVKESLVIMQDLPSQMHDKNNETKDYRRACERPDQKRIYDTRGQKPRRPGRRNHRRP